MCVQKNVSLLVPIGRVVLNSEAVRIGGLSCVYSVRNVAAHMNGAGFHHWDFDESPDDEWVVTNWDTKEKHNLDKLLQGFARQIYTEKEANTARMWKCYNKTHEVPDNA